MTEMAPVPRNMPVMTADGNLQRYPAGNSQISYA
jgi:hypothetical protein